MNFSSDVTMRIVELFAGVGGFKIGFEGAPGDSTDSPFKVVWANQWEPSTKKQHAVEIYASKWGLEPSEGDSEVYLGEGFTLVNKDQDLHPNPIHNIHILHCQ